MNHTTFRPKRMIKCAWQLNNNVELLGNIIIQIFTSPAIDRNIDIKALNIGIENTLNFRSLSLDQINEITNSISPFKNDQSSCLKFKKIFPANAKLNVGFAQTVSHNGGYEKLAYLYAARGDVQNVLRCLDSLNKYNERYDQNWNNSTNIAGYFLMYGHTKSFQEFTKAYSTSIGIPQHRFIRAIANLAGIREINGGVKFIQHGNYNENLALFDYNQVKELFGIYRSTLEEEISDRNELNFNLALSFKQQGVVYDKISGKAMLQRTVILLTVFFQSPGNITHFCRQSLQTPKWKSICQPLSVGKRRCDEAKSYIPLSRSFQGM